MTYDILVIGGGPAGMFAAITAARQGKRVLLLERNDRMGKKLLITGKGRCNVTNNCTDQEVLQNVPRNGRFLYSAMTAFPPRKIMTFFEESGCALKTTIPFPETAPASAFPRQAPEPSGSMQETTFPSPLSFLDLTDHSSFYFMSARRIQNRKALFVSTDLCYTWKNFCKSKYSFLKWRFYESRKTLPASISAF